MAEDSWADVQLLVDGQCEGDRTLGYLAGRGVGYSSGDDLLVFTGYWPWSESDHVNRMVFDAKGMIGEVLPCGHAISEQDAGEIRLLAEEALAEAATERQRRMLARAVQRLERLKGATLASGQSGCTDYDASERRLNVWASPVR